jgi:hypothetical protein
LAHGNTFRLSAPRLGVLLPRHCRESTDTSHSAMLSQLPCFGV